MLAIATPFPLYYTASASQTTFTYSWLVLASSDLAVYVDGALTLAYSLTGVGDEDGGTVVFSVGLRAGQQVVIRRITALTQPLDLAPGGPFFAATIEAAFDRVTMLVQDLRELLTLAPAFAPTIAEALRTATLPTPVPLTLLGFDALGTGWTVSPSTILTVTPDAVSGLTWLKATQTLTANTSGQLVAAALFPAGVIGLGVTMRGVASFGTGNGLVALSLGDANALDAWGSGLSRLSTLVTNAGMWQRPPFLVGQTALDVLLSSEDGEFDGTGSCTVTAHYLTVTPT